jgi:hypothetical protein
MKPYPENVERVMISFYRSLSEKDRRHYAAVEAKKLGHGGVEYIADLLDCSRQTIYAGLEEGEKK